MELKDFIRNTLDQICEGIGLAKQDQQKHGNAPIAPSRIFNDNEEIHEINHIKNIMFDLSVAIEEQTGKQGGVKISVLSLVGLSAGGEANKKSTQQTTQRIQFSVPYIPAACSPPKNNNTLP